MSEREKDTGERDELDALLVSAVSIDPSDIHGAMVRHSAELAYHNERVAVALEAHLTTKVEVKRARARAYLEMRLDYEFQGRKFTENLLEAAVEIDERVVEADRAWIAGEVQLARVKGVAQAVVSRGDMLRSLGATMRQELASEPGGPGRPNPTRERGR